MIRQAAAEIIAQRGNVMSVSLDNAKLNDILLRSAMRFPGAIQDDPKKFRDVLARIVAASDNILEATGDYKGRREFETSLEMASLSAYQLARFVRESRRKNPEWRFGTSVWMDVFYGFDLLRAWPVWVPEKNQLDIFISAYQAKAKGPGGGLEASEVHDLVTRYEPNKERAKTELAFDPEWIQRQAIEEMGPLGQDGLDRAMRDLDRARRLLGSLTENPKTAYEHWRAAHVRSRLADQFASALGMESAPSPLVRQRGSEVSLQFLVDTRRGTEVLKEEDARNYGKAA
ncbi:hypothetical protein EBS80_03115 [bacterium]|nr:hypothetical protein [bacterium]